MGAYDRDDARGGRRHDAQPAHLTLAGAGCLLIKPPFPPMVTGIDTLISRTGNRVVLAHAERYAALQRDRSLLDALGRRRRTDVDHRRLAHWPRRS